MSWCSFRIKSWVNHHPCWFHFKSFVSFGVRVRLHTTHCIYDVSISIPHGDAYVTAVVYWFIDLLIYWFIDLLICWFVDLEALQEVICWLYFYWFLLVHTVCKGVSGWVINWDIQYNDYLVNEHNWGNYLKYVYLICNTFND
jgi:hypothetical protein